MTQPVKKPRLEELWCAHSPEMDAAEADECNYTADEQEAALVALVDHRTREVHHLQQRISYYTRQVFTFLFLYLSLLIFISHSIFVVITPDPQQCQER